MVPAVPASSRTSAPAARGPPATLTKVRGGCGDWVCRLVGERDASDVAHRSVAVWRLCGSGFYPWPHAGRDPFRFFAKNALLGLYVSTDDRAIVYEC